MVETLFKCNNNLIGAEPYHQSSVKFHRFVQHKKALFVQCAKYSCTIASASERQKESQ
jgi:hypothetical protein